MIKTIPNVNFNVRVRDDNIKGDNPFKWKEMSSNDYFKKKKLYFSLFLEHLPPLVLPINYQISTNYTKILRN